MTSRQGMKRIFASFAAAALLATAQGCSSGGDGGDPMPSGTCTPTPQTQPNPTGAQSFCLAMYGAICDRGFADCAAQIGLNQMFASAADCRSYIASTVCASDFSSTGYDAACGASCVQALAHGSCAIYTAPDAPQACDAAIPTIAPPCTATITPGVTITDTITSSDPVFDGGYSKTYCVTLAAGHAVTITTAAPVSGTGIYDTVVYLIDPAGTELVSNDDYGTTLYSQASTTTPTSGVYRVVVRGYSSARVGSYQLTVTVY